MEILILEQCEEMLKLRKTLDDLGIEWYDCSESTGFCPINRTHFKFKGHEFSVINGFGTYGGLNIFNNKNLGLLEMMIDTRDPIGYLTAEDIIKRIKYYGGNEKNVQQHK